MRVPSPITLTIHRPGHIAFGAAGRLELTLADVHQLAVHHMERLILAIGAGDEPQIALHREAERTFRRAVEAHSKRGFWRTAA